jgi:hypothetical protein
MASQMKTTVDNIVSKLQAMNQFSSVLDYEPKAPPAGDFVASVWLLSAMPIAEASGLDKASLIYVLRVRIYHSIVLNEPVDDKGLLERADNIYDDFLGEFDLGGTIRAIDVYGMYGQSMTMQTGYIDVGGTMFRIADIDLPVIVNDVSTEAA